MNKYIVFTYSILGYAVGMFAVSAYALYLMDAPSFPLLGDGGYQAPGRALLINSLILVLFSLQHSGMARKVFKESLTRWIPAAAERSTYVLSSGLMLLFIIDSWQPLPFTLYDVRQTALAPVILVLYALGWGLLLLSTFQIDHFYLFGLKQAWLHLRSRTGGGSEFMVPRLYRIVRHPLYLGILMFHWATPHMTGERLLLAAGMTLYTYGGIALEERDLIQEFGEKYRQYKGRVPKLLPFPRRKAASRLAPPSVPEPEQAEPALLAK